ncbi:MULTISPECIES: ATP-binding protein [unclassified Methylobacterium]|uniref:ATP-binding protein n=1 Tax=unclassified Methylobacterium TaxID=2615210 RepID=UPI00241FC276|nr:MULTISPECIES: ATP-binding protein [unclassified Methylobacterium]WFS05098.1 ATP-binding protein [Methylobacterium sp. 391_Methyba4]
MTDSAFERLKALEANIRSALAEGPNESDTRLKALDRILFEVLGWKHEAVFTEPPTESGYIDYLLTVGERRNALIIEAKKAGLLTPATKADRVTVVSLAGPVVKPLLAGMRQALGYAGEKGAPMAVVTDGETWLFFKGTRTDGRPPLECRGILFPNLNSVIEDFGLFAELLGPLAVVERRHLSHLDEAEGRKVGDAEQHFYVFPPSEARMRTRDPLAHDASLLFSQFFSRLSDDQDREMLRDCFVETGESRKADLELQKIIQKVLNNISAISTGSGGALQAELERAMVSGRSETVLLIGNKGSGKSTFVDRFFDQILPLSVRERCVVARVDLAEYHGDPERIVSWAILQLRDRLETGVCANDPPTYDDLQGIFFKEYKRWTTGARKPLYERDKDEFKIQFGEHMENRRETQPDTYVRLLLDWAARGHGKLPCLIFDNTDQFPVEVQDAVYQLAHSLESAAPVFNIVPITDRTVWRLSKAGALQSYASKSFYLPVPEAKEIISRRVAFLKGKLKAEPKAAKSYFSRKGFQVEVNNLQMLAEAVEKVFVENDYVSGLIGRLGNFDIRRMLKLAERIFLSPEVKIDEIIKSKFGGPSVTTDRFRTHRALVKGEYDRFTETENEFISNVFETNPQRPGSPMLAFYILWVLRQRLNTNRDDSIEAAHWLVADLCDYFEGCGVAQELVLHAIRRLYDRRLIEALDPNLKQVGMADKITIKESGIAHIELVLSSTVYVEQMGLTTGINDISVRDDLRRRVQAASFIELRDVFLRYVLKMDAARITIPSTPAYSQLVEARRHVKGLSATERPPRRRFERNAAPGRGSSARSRQVQERR